MTISAEIKNTTDFLNLLTKRRETEMRLFVDKILDLRRAWMQNPSSTINEVRYNLALERYSRLQNDTVDLIKLEQKIEHLL